MAIASSPLGTSWGGEGGSMARLRSAMARNHALLADARNSKNSIERLKGHRSRQNPKGDIFIIRTNLSSHNSLEEAAPGLAEHPRHPHGFIPKGQVAQFAGGWWRFFRRDAFAGQSFGQCHEIERANAGGHGTDQRRASRGSGDDRPNAAHLP